MVRSKRILDYVSSPADIRLLNNEELQILAGEIRDEIIATTSKTGGHVASSLGAVEIILACHSVLDTPNDTLVFDVGHQSYAHKLVTGRMSSFSSLRRYQGISGFPKPSESVYDAHPSGHASDSLSVASGYAKANLLNKNNNHVVALIGDASLAGGMAFEALNYIGSQQLPMVIILNDNEMSISRNVGALMRHLGNMRATGAYRNTRDTLQERMENGGQISNIFVELGKRIKDSTKHMFLPDAMIYEQLGIVCTPPINGNSITEMRDMLELVLPMQCPVLIHAVTKKGAGYAPAEKDPVRFHGVGQFDPETGESRSSQSQNLTFTEVFGKSMVQEALADNSVVAITAAMEEGTGLAQFHELFPDRFVDVGIAEEQAVGMASGLAFSHMKPVVALYSTFMQRAIDQIAIDVALPNQNVVFALDRAGLVGADGPTHHGTFDISLLKPLPNISIIAPSGAQELADALHTALRINGPVAIRYPRGEADAEAIKTAEVLPTGKAQLVKKGTQASILSWGRMLPIAMDAAARLESQGISVAVYDMLWVKPLDSEAIKNAAACNVVVTLEDGSLIGGVGESVLEVLAQLNLSPRVHTLGIPDAFIGQGSVEELFQEIGLTAEHITELITQECAQAREDER